MNDYQKNNIEVMKDVKDYTKLQNLPTGILMCVSCGKHKITGPIVKFFNWDAHRLTCYGCQKENKEPFDERAFMIDKHQLAINHD